jgi:hypothetical protein
MGLVLALGLDADVTSTADGGRYFVACPDARGSVLAIDRAGRILWQRNDLGEWPMGLWPLRGGGCFVGVRAGIVELDRHGKTLRVIPVTAVNYVTSLQPLKDGGFLVVDYNPGQVAEIDAKGHVVWRPQEGTYYDARRLPNGETVAVGPSNEMVFLDGEGRVLRRARLEGQGVWVEPQRGGTFLVAFANRNCVARVDESGRVLWQFDRVQTAYSAHRLPGGDVLIGEFAARRIQIVSPEGRVRWSFEGIPGSVRAAVLSQ